MNIEVENPGPSIRVSDIDQFELEIGEKPPDQYRQFLNEFNGGQPEPDRIDIASLSQSPTDIQIFFGLGRHVECSDLRWNVNVYSELLRHGLLPIAHDSGGNPFCIILRGDARGRIVYVDSAGGERTWHKVASDFSGLLLAIRRL